MIDKKFSKHKKHYLLQTCAAAIFAFGVLVALGGYKHAAFLGVVGFTSLGSSAFIAFASHDAATATPRALFGGYIISVLVGVLFWHLLYFFGLLDANLAYQYFPEIFGALSIGVAMFLMAILDLGHPPAAGLALGLVMQSWDSVTLLIIFLAVMLLVVLKACLRPWLINLV